MEPANCRLIDPSRPTSEVGRRSGGSRLLETFDTSLFKRFTIVGSRFAEFRIDAYNVTNSVRWGNPSTGFSTAAGNTFGQITGTTGGQRSVRFGGRFVF